MQQNGVLALPKRREDNGEKRKNFNYAENLKNL